MVQQLEPEDVASRQVPGGGPGRVVPLAADPTTGLLPVAVFTEALPAMLADLEELVSCETPSTAPAAVAAGARRVAEQGTRALDAEPEVVVRDGTTHLRWRLGKGPRRVLVLCHQDTVWPLGTLEQIPWSVTDGVVRGPGCFDMKAGIVLVLTALSRLRGAGVDLDGVTVLVTGDEEIGSPTSVALIEDEARGCAAALVLESSADGGALKTGRKGASLYELSVTGRGAHAGLEPQKGVNSTIELAGQVLAIVALADPAVGTTVTPTVLTSGTTTNTVPATGRLSVDVRALSAAEQRRVDEAMRGLTPRLPGAVLTLSGGINRPPLEETSSADLFALAEGVSERLGLPAPTAALVGGASDGNFTAGLGVPTLDGLGAVGGGAHAADEHVLVAQLPSRAALIAGLLTDLLTDGRSGSASRTNSRPVNERPAPSPDRISGPTMVGMADLIAGTSVPSFPDGGRLDDVADAADVAAAALARRSGVRIVDLVDLDALHEVQALFDSIWHPAPDNRPVTVELMRALSKAGNPLAGAYDGAQLVGASVGFFAAPAGTSLHSHVTGVAASAQRRSIGRALKLHQRAWALERGITRISWTFDPLVRRNAWFNLGRLAATPLEYLPDFYGQMGDTINGADQSDRLLTSWALDSDAVIRAVSGDPPTVDLAALRAAGAVAVVSPGPDGGPLVTPSSSAGTRLVAVPPDVEALRRSDPDLAAAWRLAVREALGAGARVRGFAREGWYVVDGTPETVAAELGKGPS